MRVYHLSFDHLAVLIPWRASPCSSETTSDTQRQSPVINIQMRGLALSIGNFDGVHIGHQAMLTKLIDDAKVLDLLAAVMVFEPQPREFFAPDDPPARLSTLNEKLAHFAKLGIDVVIVAGFDHAFRSLSAVAFAELLKRLDVRHLVLGDDFRFGHDRMGDGAFLSASGFGIAHLDSITVSLDTDADTHTPDVHACQRASSTLIRQTLARGALDQARTLLGHNYMIMGKVTHGDKIGRTLGFPTANIELGRLRPALTGVYGVNVYLLACDGIDTDGNYHLPSIQDFAQISTSGIAGTQPLSRFGAANLGYRPSIGADNTLDNYRLEVHLPKFVGNLYDMTLMCEFITYLHPERHYADLDALKHGIDADIAALIAWRQHHQV